MKYVYQLFAFLMLFVFGSCNKNSKDLSPEFEYLKGKWKVVAFQNITNAGPQTGGTAYFDQLQVENKKLTLIKDNKINYNGKYFVEKQASGATILFNNIKINGFKELNHFVNYQNDTLILYPNIMDAGTQYYLVKQ